MQKYTTRIYFSGYVTREVTAETPYDAVIKGRKEIDLSDPSQIEEVNETLESWKHADTAEEV